MSRFTPQAPTDGPWERAIILVDMNAFFASIEQIDRPELREKPVGITNGERGTCIITCSYEARAFGVKTGMRVRDAKRLCPGFIQVPARPNRYADVSSRIMRGLINVTPDVEVFSVDEAFLDVTRCQRLWGKPEHIVARVRDEVTRASNGVPCSIGMSGDKTTAKYAAKLRKPKGTTIIPPWEAATRLANVPVIELCGIAKGIGKFLADRGVRYCGDMQHLPIGVLAKRFGNPGRRIWYMAQGLDPDPVNTLVNAPKSIGHGKVMPPNTRNIDVIKTYMLHMSEKVAARLRRHELESQHFFIGLRARYEWLGDKYRTTLPTNDGRQIYQTCLNMLAQHWRGEGVYQLQVSALNPCRMSLQGDLFAENPANNSALFSTVDQINHRYGEFTIASLRLLNRSDMPNVIAPAWKPDGHRQSL